MKFKGEKAREEIQKLRKKGNRVEDIHEINCDQDGNGIERVIIIVNNGDESQYSINYTNEKKGSNENITLEVARYRGKNILYMNETLVYAKVNENNIELHIDDWMSILFTDIYVRNVLIGNNFIKNSYNCKMFNGSNINIKNIQTEEDVGAVEKGVKKSLKRLRPILNTYFEDWKPFIMNEVLNPILTQSNKCQDIVAHVIETDGAEQILGNEPINLGSVITLPQKSSVEQNAFDL